ncbi:hypothetical protein E2C05_30815, partial [Paracraurococcus ruber]
MQDARFEQAIRDGDAAMVEDRLRAEPGLAAPAEAGECDPVALAASHGRVEVLRLLVELGGLAGPPEPGPAGLPAGSA